MNQRFFAILVNRVNESHVMACFYMGAIEGYEAAEFQVKEFAAFLYQNPGARKVWDNRVHTRLEFLDREKPPLAQKPFVDW